MAQVIDEDISNKRSATTYIAMPIVDNDKKAAMKAAKALAVERLGDRTPELFEDAIVQVGVDMKLMQVKNEETGEMETKDKEVGRFELRTTWRSTWDEIKPTESIDPGDQSQDLSGQEDSPQSP